jgi:O-antigen ligase
MALTLALLWTAAGTALLLVFPMTAPFVLPLSAVVPLAWYWAAQRRLPVGKPSPIILALVLIGAYLLINATWSLSPRWAYRTAALLWASTGVLYVMLNILDDLDDALLRAMALGVIAGMAAGGVVLCVEAFSGQAIRRTLMLAIPALHPGARHTLVLADGGTMLRPYLLNRSITELTLLFWPAVMIIERLELSRRWRAWLLIALAPGVAAIFRSEHATSKMAFAGAAAFYGLYWLYPLLSRRLAATAWVAAIVLVIPLVSLAFSHQLYRVGWLPASAQDRIVIWGYTSEQISKAPWLGAGIAAARTVNEQETSNPRYAPDSMLELSTNLHSHNAYLQIWYEAGAVGALLLLGLGLLILRALAQSEVRAQPYLHAAFVACALLAATSFSIWAPWLLTSFAIVAVAAAIGAALPASGSARPGG